MTTFTHHPAVVSESVPYTVCVNECPGTVTRVPSVRRCRVDLWSSVLRPACPASVERSFVSFRHTDYLTSGTQPACVMRRLFLHRWPVYHAVI